MHDPAVTSMEEYESIVNLRTQISIMESKLFELKEQLAKAEMSAHVNTLSNPGQNLEHTKKDKPVISGMHWPLDQAEYRRYGRQMILPEIGLQGQLSLRNASVLIIGLGGLGCPAAAYLAGAGVGTIGLVDGDTVELSNLHRQILHTTNRVGQLKVDSALESLRQTNPKIRYVTYPNHLSPINSVEILNAYNAILDCTDNPVSRYLISDAAIRAGKPLVSASALRTEGQLMVLNNPPKCGPCYRCIFPKPPPAESVISCGEGGILGPVVGVMGVLMALEAVKIITSNTQNTIGGRCDGHTRNLSDTPSMLLFSAYNNPIFRSVRLRGKRSNCAACSGNITTMEDTLPLGLVDYTDFCGVKNPVNLLNREERISAKEMSKIQLDGKSPLILDVRDTTQFNICHIDGSINIPYSSIESIWNDENNGILKGEPTKDISDTLAHLSSKPDAPIHVICRFGNDSQLTVRKLKELGLDNGGRRWIGDIRGGLQSWRCDVDSSWPDY